MKRFMKNKLIIFTIIIVAILLNAKNVYAIGGQASAWNSYTSSNVSYLFELIRAMETPTGTLGVNSRINTENYVDSSGNGIDCHLAKSTEYGTAMLLSRSEFGRISYASEGNSCAKGNTGVVGLFADTTQYAATIYSETINSEPKENSQNGALIRADERYVNRYYGTLNDYVNRGYIIRGDALLEDTVHTSSNIVFPSLNNPIVFRCHERHGGFGASDTSSRNARAVVVCGQGL